AGSRAGIKSILTIHEMSPDGKRVLDNGVMVFDGHRDHRTVELLEDFGFHDYDLGETFFDPDPWDVLSYFVWNGTAYTNVTTTSKVNVEIFGNLLNLTSVENADGSVQIRIKAVDWSGESNVTLIVVNLTGINDPPLGRPMEELVFSEGGSPFFDLSYYIYDPDDDFDTLKLEVIEAPGLNVSANISISPYMVIFADDVDFNGQTYVLMRLTDPHGASSTFELPVRILPINDPPVLKAPAELIMEEDSFINVNFTTWAEDRDDTDLEWNITISEPDNAELIIDNRTLTIIPERNWFGGFILRLNVSDGLDFDSMDIPVTVTPVNDAPILAAPGDLSILEDQEFLYNLSDLSPYDPDGDTLYWYLDNASSLIRSVAIYDNGTIRIRPLLDGYGTGTFTLRVQDGRGGKAYANFTILIEAVNDAPDFIAPEDWSLEVEIGGSRTVDLRFVPYFVEDVDDPMENLTAVTDYSLAAIDGLVMVVSVPSDTASESFQMTVEVRDPHGAVSAAHVLTIEVVDPNDIPSDLDVGNITVTNPDGSVVVTAEGRSGQTIWVVFTRAIGEAESYRMIENVKNPGNYSLDLEGPGWEDGEVLFMHLSRTKGGPNDSGELPLTFTYRKGGADDVDDEIGIYPYIIGVASMLVLVILVGTVIVARGRRSRVSGFDYESLLEE
ncbi:MAG: tandem-95 repeat protein, partial [Thermoplasmatota archaeon]